MAQHGASVAPNNGGPIFATISAPTGAPPTRNLTIRDLANEVLDLAFQYLPTNKSIKCTSRPDVKKTRLTCRRFRDLSSRYLVSRVTVTISKESLCHLELVSRHLLISKGISSICLNLALYDQEMATDFQRFKTYRVEELSRANSEHQDPTFKLAGFAAHEDILKADRITANDWATSTDGNPPIVLWRGFEDYRKCYDEQQDLLEQGFFCRHVILALAAMPARCEKAHDQ